ncbi:Retrovirus-related Pol polyprotein from transposon 412 [Frankliniella fusca]|uniref:RNA-directed DNA polymerase n=1 Tax=Frankliniella fusca TaxID=407009 RepID=A0AAE1GXA4_9NEOP|nr:Retrovirus-related Pol polyprotein from transposon 412 [Frankliniella fusca]
MACTFVSQAQARPACPSALPMRSVLQSTTKPGGVVGNVPSPANTRIAILAQEHLLGDAVGDAVAYAVWASTVRSRSSCLQGGVVGNLPYPANTRIAILARSTRSATSSGTPSGKPSGLPRCAPDQVCFLITYALAKMQNIEPGTYFRPVDGNANTTNQFGVFGPSNYGLPHFPPPPGFPPGLPPPFPYPFPHQPPFPYSPTPYFHPQTFYPYQYPAHMPIPPYPMPHIQSNFQPNYHHQITSTTHLASPDRSHSVKAYFDDRDIDVESVNETNKKINPSNDLTIGEEISLDDMQAYAEEKANESDSSEECSGQGTMLGKRFSTADVLNFLKSREYPAVCPTKNDRANFRHTAKSFRYVNGRLEHKCNSVKNSYRGRDSNDYPEYVKVIFKRKRQLELIKMNHEGADTSLMSKSLSGHRGMNATLDLLARRAWWPGIAEDVKDYVNTVVLKCKDPLRSIPPPKQNLKQIGLDIVQLPEADGFKYVVVAIDYLSKWPHAKALANKTAVEVARFIFEWICMFGCPKIVINDQGRGFCNEVSELLFQLTGTRQRITSAYNPQANGQVERQNQVIKCSLLKCLKDKVTEWPSVLEGVLFAHRVQKQRSTGYSPFSLLYGQEPVLPIDVHLQDPEDDIDMADDPDDPPEQNMTIDRYIENFDDKEGADDFKEKAAFFERYISMKTEVLTKARENIIQAQNEQKKEYDKRNNARPLFKIGQKVLLRNLRRDDRKGGWKSLPWTGPYTLIKIQDNGNCILRNLLTGIVLKSAHRQKKNLKLYHRRPSRLRTVAIKQMKTIQDDGVKKEHQQDALISDEEAELKENELTEDEEGELKEDALVEYEEEELQKFKLIENEELKQEILAVSTLRNGNIGPAVHVDSAQYHISNTCALDSIAQLLACAIADSRAYKEHVSGSDLELLNLAQNITSSQCPTAQLYELRARALLKTDPPIRHLRSHKAINAACAVTELLPRLLVSEPTCVEMSVCSSEGCPKTNYSRYFYANGRGLQSLQDILTGRVQHIFTNCKATIGNKINVL